jgi:hypothetical protein
VRITQSALVSAGVFVLFCYAPYGLGNEWFLCSLLGF